MYTDNEIVTILMCSYIGSKEGGYKPYTALQWSKLVDKIINSDIKEPKNLLNCSSQEMQSKLGVDDIEGSRILKLLSRGGYFAIQLEKLQRMGINVVTRSSEEYPKRLKTILKKYAPPILYYSGDISLANRVGIAIVGSRNIDDFGENYAKELSLKATEEGLVVISGGAKGVDVISENTALNKGGRVVSIIADSLVKKIRRKEIRDKIINKQLLLLSANNPDISFSAASAMNRNKFVYALSVGAFVIASDYNKGGTWNGALENIRNDWVRTFVVNSEKYSGNVELINKGATPLEDMNDYIISEIIRIPINKEKQIDLFTKSYDIDSSKDSFAYLKEESSGLQVNYDLYSKVIESIEVCLNEPKTLNVLSEQLRVNKSQISIWLKRALEEGRIEKLTKPVRYVSK
jgi:DNA protecting protein DprA